jgi:polar amino acid transport system substrate-binding protein
MIRLIGRMVLLVLVTLAFFGCATATDSPTAQEVKNNALRVGVSPDYPPMIFKLNDRITGAEADLALRLGNALGSPVEFVELGWDQLISSLMEGKIDIIMSGMTITEARKVRINFTDPYLKSGLVVLVRAEDTVEYDSLKKIRDTVSRVGVVRGTTGEAYVRANFLHAASVIPLAKADDAALALEKRRIDLFVNDVPSIAWLVSKNEALKGVWEPLNEEYLGWGVNRNNSNLLAQVNFILRNWKKNGTLKEVLSKWLPYWKKFDQ